MDPINNVVLFVKGIYGVICMRLMSTLLLFVSK